MKSTQTSPFQSYELCLRLQENDSEKFKFSLWIMTVLAWTILFIYILHKPVNNWLRAGCSGFDYPHV